MLGKHMNGDGNSVIIYFSDEQKDPRSIKQQFQYGKSETREILKAVRAVASNKYNLHKRKQYSQVLSFFIKRAVYTITYRLELNIIELAAMNCYVKRTNWNTDHESVVKNAKAVKLSKICPRQETQQSQAQVYLYLLLVGYIAKRQANENNNDCIRKIEQKISDLVVDFMNIFKEWRQSNQLLEKINHFELCESFSELSSQSLLNTSKNYNFIVQKILEISSEYKIKQKDKSKKQHA